MLSTTTVLANDFYMGNQWQQPVRASTHNEIKLYGPLSPFCLNYKHNQITLTPQSSMAFAAYTPHDDLIILTLTHALITYTHITSLGNNYIVIVSLKYCGNKF